MSVSPDQIRALAIAERTASSLSLLGVLVIIVTFAVSPHFRNPIRRLALLNAFFNLFDVTLTMISVDGPRMGTSSALCQAQGFLNQMFPLADVLWTLAMALDVYFVVFKRYDNTDLRKLEPRYIVLITTTTFIPAFVFLFIRTADKGPMYGSVTLWCAISPNWLVFRIAMYYAPIWASIIVTMVLYLLVGLEIWRRRRDLRSVGSDSIPMNDSRKEREEDVQQLTQSDAGRESNSSSAVVERTVDVLVQSSTSWLTDAEASEAERKSYSFGSRCSISTPPRSQQTPSGPTVHTSTRRNSTWDRHPSQPAVQHRSALSFRQYVVMPFMFLVVLLVVWVAPTTNRIASFVDPNFSSFPLLVAVGAMGSLRGFWNGVVFLTIGMKGIRRQRRIDRGRGGRV